MKSYFGFVIPASLVGIIFGLSPYFNQLAIRVGIIALGLIILQVGFVQKYPKDEALRWVTTLKPGEKIEVEGK